MSKICGIVAVGPLLEIGANGRLLYPNPTDMAFFCGYTQGKLLVMGRKTAETIHGILPGRDVICVSRDPARAIAASLCVGGTWDGANIDDLRRYARGRDIVVVGGEEVYNRFIAHYDEVYVTSHIKPYEGEYGPADAFFNEQCVRHLESTQIVFRDRGGEFSITRHYKGIN